ncbi:hypothetical protein FS837_001397 [Tulasnella sp. UAMH 9824]|nr:hypothetical protein FS837_001397 [Tulasnella sp. UAMH 9824]
MALSAYSGDEQQSRFTHSDAIHGSLELNPITRTAQATTTRDAFFWYLIYVFQFLDYQQLNSGVVFDGCWADFYLLLGVSTTYDCKTVTASKFFPVEGPDGKQHPLCEWDYFKRLDLACFKCDQALRGSYITACHKKFHVEHFTCSVCPTLLGQQDSYFEHDGAAYCRFHYSTRFATKCFGCDCAILKQFVQIWNVTLAVLPTRNLQSSESTADIQEEAEYNAVTLKERQTNVEALVYRIWAQLSGFEESAAACIFDTLRNVRDEIYIDAIRAAEKLVLHIEVLFAVIDELEAGFTAVAVGGGFIAVSRLEQYAFLLYVGVQRLDLMLQKRRDSHLLEPSAPSPDASDPPPNSYRYSSRIVIMKAWASLDRKLSAIVRRSRRSVIVEILTGKFQNSPIDSSQSLIKEQGMYLPTRRGVEPCPIRTSAEESG